MKRLAVMACVWCVAGSARAQERRFLPTVGIGMSGLRERSAVDLGSTSAAETRGDLRVDLALGLAHPVHRWSERTRLDGHAALALGPTFAGGHWQLPLREDVTLAYSPVRWLTLRAGLGLGVVVDATRAEGSYAEVGLPLGVTLFRTVEVFYRPFLSIGLGASERCSAARRAMAPPRRWCRSRWAFVCD